MPLHLKVSWALPGGAFFCAWLYASDLRILTRALDHQFINQDKFVMQQGKIIEKYTQEGP